MEHLSVDPEAPRRKLDAKTPIKIASAAATLLFLAGCNTHTASAERTPPPTPETSTSVIEKAPLTIDQARNMLEKFQPKVSPTLREFSLDTDRERAAKDAEAYLKLKDSRLVIINYTQLPLHDVEQFGQTVDKRIEYVTHSTFKVTVDVVQASDLAKKLYQEQTEKQGYSQEETTDYASVIADVTMPEIDDNYQSVIALTNDGFHGRSSTLSSGKYSDIANVATEYQAIEQNGGKRETNTGSIRDPRDTAVHEWLHGVANLEHSESASNGNGDLSGSFPTSAHAQQRVNLEEFISTAHIDEYGGDGIMGSMQYGDTLPALSDAELYETEAAERFFDMPTVTHDVTLGTGETKAYTTSTHDDIVVVPLEKELTSHATSIDRITLAPTLEKGAFEGDPDYWNIRITALTPDNASIVLMYMNVPTNDTQPSKSIVLPGNQELTISQGPNGSITVSLS